MIIIAGIIKYLIITSAFGIYLPPKGMAAIKQIINAIDANLNIKLRFFQTS